MKPITRKTIDKIANEIKANPTLFKETQITDNGPSEELEAHLKYGEVRKSVGWALSGIMGNGTVWKPVMGLKYGMNELEAVGSFVDDCSKAFGHEGFNIGEVIRMEIRVPQHILN